MERVYLLVEDTTHERLTCLLNPETLVQRRLAGVQPRRSATGRLTGAGLADDPLLCTGGGYTELELDLLFDVGLSDPGSQPENVRTLTGPLWRLAENATEGQYQGRPPLVRFLWGKEWNFPGVVVAVAERLDLFTAQGMPRRSWLRLRLLRSQPPDAAPTTARRSISAADMASLAERVSQAPEGLIQEVRVGSGRQDQTDPGPDPDFLKRKGADQEQATRPAQIAAEAGSRATQAQENEQAAGSVQVAAEGDPEVAGGSEQEPASGSSGPAAAGPRAAQPWPRWHLARRERLDQVAFRYYGDPSYWRLLAIFNKIDDPLHLPAGLVLRVPPVALVSEGA